MVSLPMSSTASPPLAARLVYLIVLKHMQFNAVRHLLRRFVLSIVVDEVAIRIHEVRDDCVIHLATYHITTCSHTPVRL